MSKMSKKQGLTSSRISAYFIGNDNVRVSMMLLTSHTFFINFFGCFFFSFRSVHPVV